MRIYHDARSSECQIHVKEFDTEYSENRADCLILATMSQTGGQTNGDSGKGILLQNRRLNRREV